MTRPSMLRPRAMPAALVLVLAASLLVGCQTGGGSGDASPSAAPDERVTDAQLQSAFDAATTEMHLPGASAMVWWPDGRTWTATLGDDVALDSNSPIRSITKSFTVTLILQLVKEGKLSLDDPIADYVHGVPNGDRVTLSQLANMTSGIVDYSKTKAFQKKFVEDFERYWAPQQLIAYGIAQPPLYDPGEGYNYSNTNTVLLGEVVEEVTNRPLVDNYERRIFKPLGMDHTSYPDSARIPEPHPSFYLVDADGGTEPAPDINLSALGASGGMVTTLDDLRVWGEALGKGTLIGPELQAERERDANPPTDGPTYDAYGLGMGRLAGWWGHTGDGIGAQAAVFRRPETGVVIAVLVNSSQDENAAEQVFLTLADTVHAER